MNKLHTLVSSPKALAKGLLVVLVLAATVFVTFTTSQTAHAGGVVGPGSPPGGGGGGAQSSYGWGWYAFSSSGNPQPIERFRDGQTWTNVSKTCRDAGARKVIAFIVETVSGSSDASKAVVYAYNELWDGPPRYSAHRSGGDWLASNDALDAYNSINADKTGMDWGTNVAWFCYDNVKNWTVNGNTTINTASASPGTTLIWNHTLTNAGPDPIDALVSWQVHGNVGATPSGQASGDPGAPIVDQSPSYLVTQADVGGPPLCQHISWTPVSSADSGTGSTADVCASVPFNYALTPTIGEPGNGNMIESAAGNISVTAQISNSGPTKSNTNIQWQLTQIKYLPGAGIPAGGISSNDPCTYFGGAICNSIGSDNEATGFGNGETKDYAANGNLGDEPVGTHLCYAMSVQPNSTDIATGSAWRHSDLHCLVVGKKPKIQVFGGDLIVGRGYTSIGMKILANVTTSVSNKAGTYYGSWTEYGIIPSGIITGMASGSGYANGAASNNLCNTGSNPSAAPPQVPLNLLSFSNAHAPATGPPACNGTSSGSYSLTAASQFDAIAARFATSSGGPTLTGSVDVTSLASKTIYSGPASGTISLSASTDIPAGKWVVINAPNANVRITSNIRYTTATLTKATDIPQLVIIAKNIIIADKQSPSIPITNVDAWLLAKGAGTDDGVVNTCDSGVVTPTGLTANVCNSKLTINGPVIANHLYLYRTAGSGVGAASGDPAEVFNLRPDAYLWASTFSSGGTKARTVMTTELPPRF